jgi:hypothetical protein
MAHVYIEADRARLQLLAYAIDRANWGDTEPALLREIRLWSDSLGLSPMGRRLLDWEIEGESQGARASDAVVYERNWRLREGITRPGDTVELDAEKSDRLAPPLSAAAFEARRRA